MRDGTVIVLVGMMGAGKTTVGKALAEVLHVPFVDNDVRIAQVSGEAAQDLLRRDVALFRKLEAECIAEHLQSTTSIVFATGGGAVATPAVAELLRAHQPVVWLQVPEANIADRIRDRAVTRPMLDGNFEERLTTLLAERAPIYEAVSDVVVDASVDPKSVAQSIAEALK